ncbi:hypothetical protein B9Z55_025132 [Caenorhabditis nigoni]|uniref:Peptidase A2 domain-containing protein n=1 Tax=Caenorhabditis nigoni TaxID=1611254 RepID=A0A2G5SX12_9PELO|nr:hypothetical protein B9Z55_025132 [Caenorhabditis nigoni]
MWCSPNFDHSKNGDTVQSFNTFFNEVSASYVEEFPIQQRSFHRRIICWSQESHLHMIDGTPIQMVLDTGAEVTLLNKSDWVKMNRPTLSPPTLNLRTATNKPIDVKGQFQCQLVRPFC